MKSRLSTICKMTLLVVVFTSVSPVASGADERQPYSGVPGWAEDREERVSWWREARFGMFIHWGLYSVAGGRWKGRDYKQHYAEWIQNWASIHPTEYGDVLKPGFNARNFDADKWAKIAKRAGMQYAVLTTKHHEGFTLFNSEHPYSKHNSITSGTNISPAGRDMVGEYTEAFRANGIRVGYYYSLLDWQHPHAYELSIPNYPNKNRNRDYSKYVDYVHKHTEELLTNYGKVDIIWWDFSSSSIQAEKWRSRELLQKIRRWQPSILTNNRLWDGLENKKGDFATPEKYVPPTGIPGLDWEVCHTMNESFGFSYHDHKWKSVTDAVRLLIDSVSKGGNLLFNVGPTPEGEIPTEAVALLDGIGEWMDDHSEAIYGTIASPFTELPFDGRCTQKALDGGNTRLYFHIFNWPESRQLALPGLKNKVYSASILPTDETLTYEQKDGATAINLPATAPNRIAAVVAVDIIGEPEVEASFFPEQLSDRRIIIKAKNALLRGKQIRIEGDHIGWWLGNDDMAFFPFVVNRPGGVKHTGGTVEQLPGQYKVIIEYAVAPGGGGRFELRLGDKQKLVGKVTPTGGWSNFRELEIGTVTLKSVGHDFLFIYPLEFNTALMNLKTIKLLPIED